MFEDQDKNQQDMYVPAQEVLAKLHPGMSIFLSTGPAEPRTLIKALLQKESGNLQDLELIQLVSFGEALAQQQERLQKFRLKTFFSGWEAGEAIRQGRVDLIPSRFSRVPRLIKSGRLNIDAAFIQISEPDQSGYCSLGLAVDVARPVLEQAMLKVGEVNPNLPRTYGDTFVHVSELQYLVRSQEEVFTFPRWETDQVFDKLAENVSALIQDGSCLGFSIGPIYEALARHLQKKRHLGVHSPFFTDALMELVRSGAVSNRKKVVFSGKSVTSYALGSRELMSWLDRNPFVEFQPMEKVFDPIYIGKNPNFVAVLPARKVDLTGRIALHAGKGNVTAGPGEATDFVNGAELSSQGLSIFALPSRNLEGEANIQVSVEGYPNLFSLREAVDMVVTEYGEAYLQGRSVRERALSLIDIAHPEDRLQLVQQAKAAKLIYQDQIYLENTGKLYPSQISTQEIFGQNTQVRFRPIKPSDEEEMRRLFYRFSNKAVYYRYFTPIKAMPHDRMQAYVNADFSKAMPIVGLVGPPGRGRIIAEARYVRHKDQPWADVAFLVDEEYQGLGIASYMLRLLMRLAKERCLQGFTADVLYSNQAMLKVFRSVAGSSLEVRREAGVSVLSMPFAEQEQCSLERWEDP
ncbi:MAG: GNAT family N-acetyltransferase [Desulfohalobiaceae bacterium]